jgi:hypothetical protein
MGPFVASLVGGRTDYETLQIFSQTQSKIPADLHDIISVHAPHLRSLVVQGQLKDSSVLNLCTYLERFECETIPSDELVAAIPRTIQAFAVTDTTPDSALAARVWRSLGSAAPLSYISAAYLTEQLGSFPSLRVFRWMGSTAHPGFAALRERCGSLRIELHSNSVGCSFLIIHSLAETYPKSPG